MSAPSYVTKCGDCVHFARIQHRQEYFCKFHGGLSMVNPVTWCCYGKPRLDALEREETKGKGK